MPGFRLPTDGLTISYEHTTLNESTSQELPPVIQLNLVENYTKDILKSLRNNEQVRLKLGKKSTVHYGRKQPLKLDHVSDKFSSQFFAGPLDGSEPVYFSGKLSHILEVQQANKDTAGADEALATLVTNINSLKQSQASTSIIGSTNESKKSDIKSVALASRDRFRGAATPSSPFHGASPLGPGSIPFSSSTPSKDKIRQDAIRIPLVHLLATGPMTPEAVAKKLNASQADCDRVLEKVSKDAGAGNKELKDKPFRELDVHKFRYPSEQDRKQAIDRAIHAYDRMRIDKNDPIWQLLLPSEERGKGKTLSRLKLNVERPPPAPTPKLGTDGEGKKEALDKEVKAKKPKAVTNTKEPIHKKKPSGEAAIKKKVERGPTKAAAQPTKSEGKFKSSERIEDSDEEAEGVEVVPAKPKAPRVKEKDQRPAPSPRPISSVSANGHHKSKLSNSSSSSNDSERSRLPEGRSKLKPQPKSERSPTASRISPRPRVDSSPQKPSPLGSSPPTNSTDLENSSKSSVQSSAPSSPPSSTDMPLSQARKNYSPVITGKGKGVSSQPKRKGEKGDEPPAKRQQFHGLGLPKTLTEKRQQPTPERRSSESSLSSPEKPNVTKESVVDATLKFREYYTKYKDLHMKLNRQDPDDRTDRDLDQLWRMHERLERIKSDLWTDWAKAGGDMPA